MRSNPEMMMTAGQSGYRKFVVTLCQNEKGGALVRSCEIIGDGFRNRTSFGKDATLSDVFVGQVSDGIEECLNRLSGQTEVLSFPEFVIETKGLLLAGLHLIVTAINTVETHIICRFGTFLGGVNHAFRHALGFDGQAGHETGRLSAMVFSDLVLPVLNICQSAQQEMETEPETGVLQPMARKFGEKWQELQFQVELLKRFVEFTPHPEDVHSNDDQPVPQIESHAPLKV